MRTDVPENQDSEVSEVSNEAQGSSDEAPSPSRREFIKTAAVAADAIAAAVIGELVMHALDLVRPAHAA